MKHRYRVAGIMKIKGSISGSGRKSQKVWIEQKVAAPHTSYTVTQIVQKPLYKSYTAALYLSNQPACLLPALQHTHQPAQYTVTLLTEYIMDQTISSSTQNTQDLIEGNNNLFNMDYLLCLDQGAQCFPQCIFYTLNTRVSFYNANK